jgi:dienelactone hydrolase
MMSRGKRLAIGAMLILIAIATMAVVAYAPALAFLMDIAGAGGALRRVLPVASSAYSTVDVAVPTRWGPVTTRVYTPAGRHRHTAVVFPGVHGGGVDEPRLALFCGRLAATGLTVVCTPLPELREFRITGRSTDAIEDITVWASQQGSLAPHARVALVGVSFSGGLALVAAGRDSLRGRLEIVLSVGGYGDLPRALRYLCTGMMPDGTRRAPHDYGLAVIALAAVPWLVPPEQVATLEAGIRTFLEASLDDSATQERAKPLVAGARTAAAGMPEPARAVLTEILDRNVSSVGNRLLPVLPALGRDPALSPERSPATDAPVFLIHGRDDNVIPSSETPLLAADLARRGNRHVRWLLTPLLSHAELGRTARVQDAWALLSFWRDVLSALDD